MKMFVSDQKLLFFCLIAILGVYHFLLESYITTQDTVHSLRRSILIKWVPRIEKVEPVEQD